MKIEKTILFRIQENESQFLNKNTKRITNYHKPRAFPTKIEKEKW